MGSRYTGRSSARIDLILPNGQPISSRAISKIRNDECGQRYAAEQLAAAGARTRRPGENGAHWLAELERSGFMRRQKHQGNHVYLFPLTQAARLVARAVQRLPHPVPDRAIGGVAGR